MVDDSIVAIISFIYLANIVDFAESLGILWPQFDQGTKFNRCKIV